MRSRNPKGNGDIFTVGEVLSIFRLSPKKTVTFVGYSGQGYQKQDEMLGRAKEILSKLDPKKWVVNIGVTPDGIGSIYASVAKEMGFETTGIVSSLAQKYLGSVTAVDHYYLIADPTWGGRMADGELSPTSEAMVSVSDLVVSIGGGDVGRDETAEAIHRQKPVLNFDAEINHEKAIAKAQKNNQPTPTSFFGSNNFIEKPVRSLFLDYSEQFEIKLAIRDDNGALQIQLISHLDQSEKKRAELNGMIASQLSVSVAGHQLIASNKNVGGTLASFRTVLPKNNEKRTNIEIRLLGELVTNLEVEDGKANVLQIGEPNLLGIFQLRQLAKRGTSYFSKIKSYLHGGSDDIYAKAYSSVTDLHTHFSGALRAESIIHVALKNRMMYPLALLEELQIPFNASAITELGGRKFLPLSSENIATPGLNKLKNAMAIPVSGVITFQDMETIYKYRGPLVKSPAVFAELLWELANDYKKSGVDYAELSLSDIVKPDWLEAAHRVLPEIEAKTGVKIRFLVGLWRHSNPIFNNDIINKLEALDKTPYIVGVDFMGHETNSTHAFETEIRRLAKYRAEKNPTMTIRVHAGENPLHPENVKVAIEAGATRIGHGLYGVDDEVIQMAKDRNVVMEFQIISNLSLNNVQGAEEIPLVRYAKKGARVSLGTDGGGLYRSSSLSEFVMAKAMGLTRALFASMRKSDVSHIDEMQKTFRFKIADPGSLEIPAKLPQEVFTDVFWKEEADKKKARTRRIAQNLLERGIQEVERIDVDKVFEGKTPVLFSGASKKSWPLISETDQKEIILAIKKSLDQLDPKKTFIMTGGTEFGVEEIVHREARLRGFQIYGTFVTDAEVSSLAEEQQLKKTQGSSWKQEIGQLTHFGFYGDQWYDKSAKVLELVKNKNGLVIFMGGGNILSDEIQAAENVNIDYLLMRGPAGAADRFSHIYEKRAFVGAEGLTKRLKSDIGPLLRESSTTKPMRRSGSEVRQCGAALERK